MLNYAGADQRQDDLFMNENLFSRGKSLVKGLQVRFVELFFSLFPLSFGLTIYLLRSDRLSGSRERLHSTQTSSALDARSSAEGPTERNELPFPGG